MGALNTYGLTPTKQWKLWEIDGFQLLVTLEEDKDNEDHDCVRFATNIDEMGEVAVSIKGPPAVMQKAFGMAATDEASARQNLQGLLDQVVKTFPSLAPPQQMSTKGRE